MNFQRADIYSVAIFILFLAFMIKGIAQILRSVSTSKKFYFLFLGYLAIFSAVVVSGLPIVYLIPVVPLLFLSVLVFFSCLAFSNVGLQISQKYSFAFLVGFQFFRVPLELTLHHWADIGTIPDTMTWTGQNWDIISGLLALVVFPFANKFRWAVWLFQICGFALLLNVFRVVIMSSGFLFSWPMVNPLQLLLYFPYALIGPLFVGPALLGHLILFRKLLAKRI